jgi:hypothetical protein
MIWVQIKLKFDFCCCLDFDGVTVDFFFFFKNCEKEFSLCNLDLGVMGMMADAF